MVLKLLIYLIYLFCGNIHATRKAVVIKPVIDLLSSPASSLNKQLSPPQYYQRIPLSPVNPGKNIDAGPRLHQALFNELVEIIEETATEAKIKILNAYYLHPHTKAKIDQFWTLKQNLIDFNQIKRPQLLPLPLNYLDPQKTGSDTITLTQPWYCHNIGQFFSAGTRFKINPQNGHAYCYMPQSNEFTMVEVPSTHYLVNQKRSPNKLRQLFVNLIDQWAASQTHKQAIPYTWGGCSFTQKVPTHRARHRKKRGLNYYEVPHARGNPYCGLDCSGLVLRAAQTVEIPYFFKNTTTLESALTPLAANEIIQMGDLIKISGHVIVIADPKTGDCFEARDYSHGYGLVQRIHISKLFDGISNLEQLKAAHLNGKPLIRLDKDGNARGSYQVKLLKLL